MTSEPTGKAIPLLRRFWRWTKPHRRFIWWMVLFQALAAPLGIVSPWIISDLIDHQQDLIFWGTILVGLSLLTVLFDLARGYAKTIYDNKLLRDLRLNLYLHMQRLSLRYYSDRETGTLMSRQVDDVSNLEGVMAGTFVTAGVNLVMALIFSGLLIVLEWRLATAAITLVVVVFALQYMISGELRRRTRRERERWTEVSRMIHQAISGQFLVRAAAAEPREASKFKSVLMSSIWANVGKQLFNLYTGQLFGLIAALAPALIVLFGIYLIQIESGQPGAFTVGDLFAFFMYLGSLFGAVVAVARINPALQSSLASLERIYEVVDTEPEIIRPPGDGKRLEELRGEILLEGVSFGYTPDKLVLRDIDLHLPAHGMVALVGSSGSGKSTLANLLPRFFDPTSGRVLIDGEDIKTLDLSWLRRHIGLVPQEIFLFDRSITENLTYGRPDASMDEVRSAARAANALEFIEALPEGFETTAGERGAKLSGGQRQRLAIAREILSDPAILILDEATSALDSETEALIQQALESLFEGRTAVVIAHRLSTIMCADCILVLDAGRIVQQGTHEELADVPGLYQRLCRSQFLDGSPDRQDQAAEDEPK